ncbi:SCO6745 family protein [Spirillospora albida]|uniref:SCO6745 family protein n=1 Tax=Spirillospora albida TaxID=58123 RepID=UPI0004BF9F4C|nr:hypothetical protein [Spirillospora albida]
MGDSVARDMWLVVEPLHAVTYFAPECLAAHREVGLKGFWMGYFGGRAAPLGAAPAGVVEATFYGFHPARVRRAVPDAWGFASPEDILRVRGTAAAAVLRRLAPGIDGVAASAAAQLARAVAAADGGGRPLFAANRDLDVPDDPVEALWLMCTALREHRGDGHNALLAAEGLSGLEANVLASAVGTVPAQRLRDSRGWSEEEWDAAAEALAGRGLVRGPDATGAGRDLRASIEDRTDALAAPPYRALDDPEALYGMLVPFARAAADEMPFPNPIGLPRPS